MHTPGTQYLNKRYSNKRSQAASYTDRVLWRSRPGCEDHVSVQAYLGLHDLHQSDHRPVVFQATVKTQLPYINVHSPSRFMGGVTCDLCFTDLHVVVEELEEVMAQFLANPGGDHTDALAKVDALMHIHGHTTQRPYIKKRKRDDDELA